MIHHFERSSLFQRTAQGHAPEQMQLTSPFRCGENAMIGCRTEHNDRNEGFMMHAEISGAREEMRGSGDIGSPSPPEDSPRISEGRLTVLIYHVSPGN